MDVGEGQKLYYLEWGNRKGVPFIVLHGGPGGSFDESFVALFDPNIHHVVFFDQRGCGESTPSATGLTKEEIENTNTPTHLIKDVEIIRTRFFGNKKVNIAGGSWGSTLALLYAIAHPQKVASLHLWSTFLSGKAEIEETYEDRTGNPDFPLGKEWEWFISHIPESERSSGRTVLEYLAKMVSSQDPDVARKYAVITLVYEYALCNPPGFDIEKMKASLEADPNLVSLARIELIYLLNGSFIPDGYILANVDKIKHIPCHVVHGTKDWNTPLKYTRAMESAYGENCEVEVVDSGHLRSDPNMKEALQRDMRVAAKK